ncbi:hypothetical protein JQU17_08060 [Ponticoccus sp. SC2-23]|uniref:DUF6173 family protein n=1 Tax=Alexandriicola marinus TaxID=2081710 RepID=UPI00193BF80D|nr:DUF6173 family protein [Alexandriicola marinus]MBM1220362.1 hypothetical protein [Ponticoccus sp. SC6-9]MBM1225048.1 hypothetical protein [Ponticoccus sp. SC6-15]MBM1228562.1 hypothetical protein [Ponticoccus sp. SC6-38]MBM1233801.1 hypothetical protein [Ponticoccus sp. SC6-45]MBM1239063.1 hypothetical protein [Ponticoccus sp. SC6-49]MBM1242845.1 hypothetical protein [Ponticoccus sp. SC2-64]MBM1247325.1 hypothetical protein [Ponticoccus sp. SC6-42]MBM1252016.1 hypothetical protein [Ponti
MSEQIATAAEAEENSIGQRLAMPRVHEVHADPDNKAPCESDLPDALRTSSEAKSPARWAYERLILYIRNFEEKLDNEHEVAMGFTGGDAGVIRIEGLGDFDPDLITFYGADPTGSRTQLIQHVSQLNVMLRALPKTVDRKEPRRIGFRLASDLEQGATPATDATTQPPAGA